ncbi:MAG: DUF4142 domain-containing protein [Verrucomicrobiales bacterium]
MKTLMSIYVFLTCLLGAAAVVEPRKEPPLMPAEVKFVERAGQSSLNEIHIATLGTKKSQNPELKKLAGTLVTDHTAVLAEAKSLAVKNGIVLPTASDEVAAKTYKELDQKSGSDFDAAFIAYLDKGHIKSIKSFEEAQKTCRDADLKAWIDQTLLVIKAHHELIKKLK